jgi:hypothetical protein
MLTLQKAKMIGHAELITETQNFHVITFYTSFHDDLSSSGYIIVTYRLKTETIQELLGKTF